MWNYTDKSKIVEYLLSLNLLNCEKKEYIKKIYSISNNIENNYKVFKIKKKNGNYRTIYSPNSTLKHIQRQLLKNVLYERKPSKYACAYKIGSSLRDNAICHVNKKIILKLDIESFFDSIEFMTIYNSCFPLELYPKEIGMLFTYLCSYDDYLPQGAPTSAYISNLVMRDFDISVGSWCDSNNISYTRYCDDMTFSGDFNVSDVISKVNNELKKLSLNLNREKIHVIHSNNSQIVTGIVVNDHLQVSSKYRNNIRKEIYYINKYGIESHLKYINCNIDKNIYLSKLYGKVLFVLQINSNDKEFLKYKEFLKSLK